LRAHAATPRGQDPARTYYCPPPLRGPSSSFPPSLPSAPAFYTYHYHTSRPFCHSHVTTHNSLCHSSELHGPYCPYQDLYLSHPLGWFWIHVLVPHLPFTTHRLTPFRTPPFCLYWRLLTTWPFWCRIHLLYLRYTLRVHTPLPTPLYYYTPPVIHLMDGSTHPVPFCAFGARYLPHLVRSRLITIRTPLPDAGPLPTGRGTLRTLWFCSGCAPCLPPKKLLYTGPGHIVTLHAPTSAHLRLHYTSAGPPHYSSPTSHASHLTGSVHHLRTVFTTASPHHHLGYSPPGHTRTPGYRRHPTSSAVTPRSHTAPTIHSLVPPPPCHSEKFHLSPPDARTAARSGGSLPTTDLGSHP